MSCVWLAFDGELLHPISDKQKIQKIVNSTIFFIFILQLCKIIYIYFYRQYIIYILENLVNKAFTCENHNSILLLYTIFEGKLYIQTGKVKDVSKQIKANPKVERCAFADATATFSSFTEEPVVINF